MAISPNDRQRVFRTSRVEDVPNPGPWPQATPVGEVSQPGGGNYTGYTGDGQPPAPTPTIGTVTVTGEASPTVGDTETYTATSDGTATDVQFAFSAPGETFSGGTVTWANDGATTVTCTATSVSSQPMTATGTLAVTVAAAPVVTLTLSSTDFNNGAAMPVCAGSNAGCVAQALSPQLSWTLANDPGTITEWRLRMTDNNAGDYLHWSVDAIPFATTSIASTTDPLTSNWPGGVTINQTDGGPGAAFANGFEGTCPGVGDTHTYSFVVTGHDNGGNVVVTSAQFTGQYTG